MALRSERIPGRPLGEFEIVEIDAQAPAQSGADGNHDDALGAQGGEAQAADKIGRPVEPAKAVENRSRIRQIVNQHHGPVAVGAGVEADRRALPIDSLAAGVAGEHFAFAVSQAPHERARGLLAENIGVGQAPAPARFLDALREPARNGAKEPLAVVDDLLRGELRGSVGSRGRRESGGARRGQGQELSARHCSHCHILRGGRGCAHAFGVSRSTRGGASQALTDGQSSPSRVDRKLTDSRGLAFAGCGARGTVHHRPGGWRTVMTSIRPRGPIQPDMTQPVRLTMIAAPTAGQKPATMKPGRNQATSRIISALMTSRNSPSVKSVTGRVRTTMTGRTEALTMPSRRAAASRVSGELNTTPETMFE